MKRKKLRTVSGIENRGTALAPALGVLRGPLNPNSTTVKLFLDFPDMRLYDVAVSGVFEAPSNRSDWQPNKFLVHDEKEI